MTSSIRKNLSLPNMISSLATVSNSYAKDQQFLEKVDHSKIRSEYHLHWLYLIIKLKFMTESVDEVLLLCDQIKLLPGLADFIVFFQNRGMGSLNEISDEAAGEMLQLIQIILRFKRQDELIQTFHLSTTKIILESLYHFIQYESKNTRLLQKFLECLAQMRRHGQININEELYSDHLTRAVTKLPQYLQFMMEYFRRRGEKNKKIVENLIRGLIPRLGLLMETEEYRSQLADALLALAMFLKTEPLDSIWLSTLLRSEYSSIFDALLTLTTKNFNYLKLSNVFNIVVQVYLDAQMSNIHKYELIIRLFKFIIQKSSSFFSFVATRQIAFQKNFVFWFVKSELHIQKAKEIVNVYFSSQYALQFLLVMMIYFMNEFAEQSRELFGFMRGMNLLEESKYFISNQNIRQYLKIFYYYANASDQYEDFVNSIQDRVTSRLF